MGGSLIQLARKQGRRSFRQDVLSERTAFLPRLIEVLRGTRGEPLNEKSVSLDVSIPQRLLCRKSRW